MLEGSALRAPGAPALEAGPRPRGGTAGDSTGPAASVWSYADLADASSRIASALVERGVQAGDRVGVCLPKSPAAVAALFGILKAGAVFVPLDRRAPAARLASILSDCAARGLVSSGARLADLTAALPPARRLSFALDASGAGSAPAPARPSAAPAGAASGTPVVSWAEAMEASPASAVARRPADLAYILYTSGSTGYPKGVMISHENCLAFTSWARRRFAVGPNDRVTSVAPLHFDLSTFDLYTTLEAGATVLLVPGEVALFPASLGSDLESRRATITYLVPSTLTALVLRGDLARRDLRALRLILFAGEVFPGRYLAMLMEALPRPALFNLYGPTETNVCTCYEVRPEDRERAAPLPIGRPASGDSIFALDDSGAPVLGPGAEGELYCAGPTVALGYWGDAERTARTFLEAHPHAPPGRRIYRTGDRVSLDASGEWLFHGRRDHMVKSRGYRIELGDIEAALYAHPGVAEAAAVAIPDEEIGSRIKACVTLREGASADAPALVRHCAERLPRYMVPEAVEFYPSLPKTSTGKVDRARLAAGGPATAG